jgi:uncharacterized protein DUF4419
MTQSSLASGITFSVDDVEPATEPLDETQTHEELRQQLRSRVESCFDYHGTALKNVYCQPLLHAVHAAFAGHRPLVLTPDALWITITQGVAHHMTIHGERLRNRFVSHEGRLRLAVMVDGWVEGSPENPWPEVFAGWADLIRDHVGAEIHDALVCDFSTTGTVERAASQIVMMDIFERYFHYELLCVCGIPSVTLEGSTADWQRLADKAARLKEFDLGWWLEHLLPICEQFVRASRGDIDLTHWQGICKLRQEYGGDIINGWIAKLFPYLRAFTQGPCNRRNPIFETGEGFQSWAAPTGLSQVPFVWRNCTTGTERTMEAIGGIVGVKQDRQTMALRPVVGWAVRTANKLDTLIDRIVREHRAFPAVRSEKEHTRIPRELMALYHRTDGAELFVHEGTAAVRIVAKSDFERLNWDDSPDSEGIAFSGYAWHRFATLADGSWLAVYPMPRHRRRENRGYSNPEDWAWHDTFVAICHCSAQTVGKVGKNPIVAESFEELFKGLLANEGQPYWLAPGFAGYGDAEICMLRPEPPKPRRRKRK